MTCTAAQRDPLAATPMAHTRVRVLSVATSQVTESVLVRQALIFLLLHFEIVILKL